MGVESNWQVLYLDPSEIARILAVFRSVFLRALAARGSAGQFRKKNYKSGWRGTNGGGERGGEIEGR
jgi:hypothetical protein